MASTSCSATVSESSIGSGGNREDDTDMMENGTVIEEDMDTKRWGALPEEILDKIIARLPLHSLYRALVLSKKWKEKVFSLPFRAELTQVCRNWGSFYPIFLGPDSLHGFDRHSNCWKELFPICYLPDAGLCTKDGHLIRQMIGVAGCLLGFKSRLNEGPDEKIVIHVTNPISQKWIQLPDLPPAWNWNRATELESSVQLVPFGPDRYKVIVIMMEMEYILAGLDTYPRCPLSIQIYDSGSRSWTEDRPAPNLSSDWRYKNSTYFEGTVYMLLKQEHGFLGASPMLNDLVILLAYDIESDSFRHMEFSFVRITKSYFWWCKVIACGSELMVVVAQMDPRTFTVAPAADDMSDSDSEWDYLGMEGACIRPESLLIYKLDPITFQMTELSRGPSERLHNIYLTKEVAGDDQCLYFETLDSLDSDVSSVLVFDVSKENWYYIPHPSCQTFGLLREGLPCSTNYTFQPGLNPFIIP